MSDSPAEPVSTQSEDALTEAEVLPLQRRVDKLVKKRKFEEAVSFIEASLLDHPKSLYLTHLLGWTLEYGRQHAKAREAYLQALQIEPDSALTNSSLGELLFRMGRFSEALPYLVKCTIAWPDSSSAHSSVGLALLRLDKPEEAEPILEKAISLSQFNPDARSGMAEVYTKTGRRALLGDLYNAYIAGAPDLASSHAFMADHLHFDLGDAAGSLSFYENALDLGHRMKDPGWFRQYLSTAGFMGEVVNSYLSALDASGFDDLARRVARDECDRTEFQVWTTHRLERNGDIEGAERIFVRVLDRYPDAHSWRFRLGRLEMLGKDFESAERDFRLAIEHAEAKLAHDVWYSAGLALALEGQGRSDEAAQVLAGVRRSHKPRVLEALMALHADLGNWKEALEVALEAMSDNPMDGYLLDHAARAYSSLGKVQDALGTYQKLIELQPRNGKARLGLAEMLLQNGRAPEALSTLDRALENGSLSRPQRARANELQTRARSLGTSPSR